MHADVAPGPDETLDRIAADWKVFQLRRGHRFSTDDQVTAWRASLARPDAREVLDLGCGVGSVGLITLALLGRDDVPLTGIEAQDISVGLYRKTIAYNRLDGRIRLLQGDLRDSAALIGDQTFDLVTGSPPYVPLGKGIVSPHPQRAACRMELRGSVFDYCAAARRHLAPGGRFVFVMAAADARTEAAPVEHGLAVLERWDYVLRPGAEPLIATLVCAREEDGPFEPRRTGRLVIRGEDGEWTQEYLALRSTIRPEGDDDGA
jgi:tRNA1Val (adenine37-N6)-methyltransferase